MATATTVPFALGLIGGLALFGVWLHFLIEESHQPVRGPTPRRVGTPHISHARVVIVGVLFVAWSIWSTARPVSGWW